MSKRHGVKRHYQVLLDPHRADLFDEEAEKRGFKASAYMRELVYQALERTSDASVYGLALALDEVAHREAIQRQVVARNKARQARRVS